MQVLHPDNWCDDAGGERDFHLFGTADLDIQYHNTVDRNETPSQNDGMEAQTFPPTFFEIGPMVAWM